MADFLSLASVHLLPQIVGAADLVLPSKQTNMLASGRPVVATAAPGTWPIDLGQTTDRAMSWLWYKIASGESGSYTVTHAAATRRGIMVRVTGNDTTTPFLPNPSQNSARSQTTTFTGVTTSVDGTLILVFASDYNDLGNNLTAPAGTTPTTPGFCCHNETTNVAAGPVQTFETNQLPSPPFKVVP